LKEEPKNKINENMINIHWTHWCTSVCFVNKQNIQVYGGFWGLIRKVHWKAGWFEHARLQN